MTADGRVNLAIWLMIIGLVAVLLYAAINSFMHPDDWVGYFPHWMRGIVPESLLLNGFSLFEIVLSLWLLSRKYLFYSAVLTALLMFGIMVFNPSQLIITFRDVAILFAALALAVLNYKKDKSVFRN